MSFFFFLTELQSIISITNQLFRHLHNCISRATRIILAKCSIRSVGTVLRGDSEKTNLGHACITWEFLCSPSPVISHWGRQMDGTATLVPLMITQWFPAPWLICNTQTVRGRQRDNNSSHSHVWAKQMDVIFFRVLKTAQRETPCSDGPWQSPLM